MQTKEFFFAVLGALAPWREDLHFFTPSGWGDKRGRKADFSPAKRDQNDDVRYAPNDCWGRASAPPGVILITDNFHVPSNLLYRLYLGL